MPSPAFFAIAGIPIDLSSLIAGAAVGAVIVGLALYFSFVRKMSSALARIYEAEARGLINKEERMQLSQKYKVQLKEVEDKISKAQAIVDVADLEDAKAELLNLVNQKISQIDARLEDLKQKISPLVPAIEKIVQPEITQPKEKKEKQEETVKKPEIM